MSELKLGQLLYENPLATPEDIQNWTMEGPGECAFIDGQLRLSSAAGKGNSVFWCPEDFPDRIRITWNFQPVREPGLAILFFAAQGSYDRDLFDRSLAPRNGEYPQYHSSDINALHMSYFRRKWDSERAFHTCNLRKSAGFHLVAQGADPLPDVPDATHPYHMEIIKAGVAVSFQINDLTILTWEDDRESYGPLLTGGKLGFRQMAPLQALYSNLKIHALET